MFSHDIVHKIESLEKEGHQFFPFRIECEDGREPYDCYILHEYQKIDCIDFEASGYKKKVRSDGSHYWGNRTYSRSGTDYSKFLKLKNDIIKDRHFWISVKGHDKFFSPMLADLIREYIPTDFDLFEIDAV